MTLFRLLVVENDSELRLLLARGLGEEGFTVHAVGDAAAAMARLRRKLYEVSARAAIETAHGIGYRLS